MSTGNPRSKLSTSPKKHLELLSSENRSTSLSLKHVEALHPSFSRLADAAVARLCLLLHWLIAEEPPALSDDVVVTHTQRFHTFHTLHYSYCLHYIGHPHIYITLFMHYLFTLLILTLLLQQILQAPEERPCAGEAAALLGALAFTPAQERLWHSLQPLGATPFVQIETAKSFNNFVHFVHFFKLLKLKHCSSFEASPSPCALEEILAEMPMREQRRVKSIALAAARQHAVDLAVARPEDLADLPLERPALTAVPQTPWCTVRAWHGHGMGMV